MATRTGSRRASGSTATKNVPGNQTPNTPDVNESEIARLKVDQLRDRLRRRGITGTADMRKDELVDALITALREGRKTTRSRNTSGGGPASRSDGGSRGNSRDGGTARGRGGSRGGGSRGNQTGEQPGNQTPNTPEVNESEIARLKVDQLRDRLRRRGITGTADMRKDELVDALITALREGRKTTGSGTGRSSSGRSAGSDSGRSAGSGFGRSAGSDSGRSAGSGFGRSAGSDSGRSGSGRSAAGGRSATPDRSGARRPRSESPEVESPEVELAEVERRAAELADVTPLAVEVEEVERRAAELEEAVSESTTTARPNARVPQPRSGSDDDAGTATGGQPVRTHAGQAGSGPALSMESADRVLTSIVPAEMEPVDEVVTPEGTVLTAEEGTAVATPPLPGTDARDRASSPSS
ncbi:hypothetical protein ABZ754_08540 [Micromonospora purpureochromogenes]|uniref:hypothetical protein n=1 Tax=Micromonospora purpureochromogenes TaxID=47872 RepID=UPI003405D3C3